MTRYKTAFIFPLTALLFSLVSTFAANAFDFAQREIIGFSADGNFFAFEQYGTQDGSGFAYSDIFIIDTRSDKWARGSPYRYLLKDVEETTDLNAGIAKARKTNRLAAKIALVDIVEPGIVAASNRADAHINAPLKISIAPKSFWLPDNIKLMHFRIDILALTPPPKCVAYGLGDEFFGFKLTRTGVGGSDIVMHEDISIPASRNCPLGYEPSDVIIHISDTGKYTVAVLLRMMRIGFEGADRRFIAVSGALN